MKLSVLPVEILLEIIQYLPFKAIGSFSTLSKEWAAFVDANESPIYHNASKRYGFVPKDDVVAPPEGWKAWCEYPRRVFVEDRVTLPQLFASSRSNSGGSGSSLEITTQLGSPEKRGTFTGLRSTKRPDT